MKKDSIIFPLLFDLLFLHELLLLFSSSLLRFSSRSFAASCFFNSFSLLFLLLRQLLSSLFCSAAITFLLLFIVVHLTLLFLFGLGRQSRLLFFAFVLENLFFGAANLGPRSSRTLDCSSDMEERNGLFEVSGTACLGVAAHFSFSTFEPS